MKLIFAAAAVLLALSAPAAASVPQSRFADSDDHNCNQGDPRAPWTIAACQRLRDTRNDPGPEPGALVEEDAMAARAASGEWRTSDAAAWPDERPYRLSRPTECGRRGQALLLVPVPGGGSVLVAGRSGAASGC